MKKGLLVFAVILLIFFGLTKWVSASFFSVKKYHLMQTGLFSDDYFSSIKIYISQLLDNNCCARTLIAQVKKEFPIISTMVVAYRPCGMYAMLYAHKPVCCINDEYVIAADNELIPKNYFAAHALDSIAHISVAQECFSKVSSLVPVLLRELPSHCNQAYSIELVNEHYLRLTDKKEQGFSIISSVEQQKMPLLLTHCESVKKNIAERKGFDKGIKWVADIRFADYIILYPMLHSVMHGDPCKKNL